MVLLLVRRRRRQGIAGRKKGQNIIDISSEAVLRPEILTQQAVPTPFPSANNLQQITLATPGTEKTSLATLSREEGGRRVVEISQESREALLQSQVELLRRENERLLLQQRRESDATVEYILGTDDAPPDYVSQAS